MRDSNRSLVSKLILARQLAPELRLGELVYTAALDSGHPVGLIEDDALEAGLDSFIEEFENEHKRLILRFLRAENLPTHSLVAGLEAEGQLSGNVLWAEYVNGLMSELVAEGRVEGGTYRWRLKEEW